MNSNSQRTLYAPRESATDGKVEMAQDDHHKRTMDDALRQIQSYRTRSSERRWQLDVPLWRLAAEGISVLVVGLPVGFGLAILWGFIVDYWHSS